VSDVVPPSIIVLCSTVVLLLLLRMRLKDFHKAGVIVSALWILFFSYGHVYRSFENMDAGPGVMAKHILLFPAFIVIFSVIAFAVIRSRRRPENLTKILNIISCALVAISLFSAVRYKAGSRDFQRSHVGVEKSSADSSGAGDVDQRRDIYYIILDGYASAASLRTHYDFDNYDFIDALTAKGFYVPYKSRSNYAETFLSLASSLSMKYVNYLSDSLGVTSTDRAVPYRMIQDSRVVNLLKQRGYSFIHFESGWGATGYNKHADINIKCGRWNEFLTILIQTSMLCMFERQLVGDDARKRILCMFSKLGELHGIAGPKFVFAHMLIPHPPYLFTANGDPVMESTLDMHGSVWKLKSPYIEQLKFTNAKVEKLVDDILRNSSIAPIIILQADHGSASSFNYMLKNRRWRWRMPATDTMLRERMTIFNAYYLPGDAQELLYDSISPVNTFRVIFNHYFRCDYKLLSDRCYFSSYLAPYKFKDVTRRIRIYGRPRTKKKPTERP
jgi:hypothetical protein